MILDAEQVFSARQAVTADAASTNVIDLGADRDVGTGEPLAVVVICDVELDGTTPTIVFQVQTDTVENFASPTLVAQSKTYSALAAGERVVIPLPPDLPRERYLRLNYDVNGTSPTITVSAFLQPLSMIHSDKTYPDAVTIS